MPFRTKRANLFYVAAVAILCATCYCLGIWLNSVPAVTSSRDGTAAPCIPQLPRAVVLDFASHHRAEDLVPNDEPVPHFPACPSNFTEYTPCEDVQRSLRFDRDRFVLAPLLIA